MNKTKAEDTSIQAVSPVFNSAAITGVASGPARSNNASRAIVDILLNTEVIPLTQTFIYNWQLLLSITELKFCICDRDNSVSIYTVANQTLHQLIWD